MKSMGDFDAAVAEFDRLNARDPNIRLVNGEPVPFELFFANRMTEWVVRLDPEASEVVRLAARCQHLCRWEIPRLDYPDGRVGYLKWRSDLKKHHARKSAEVLRQVGFEASIIDRVKSINLKEGLGRDPEVQLIEDALCLVFLEQQFDDLMAKTEEGKMIGILQKTWAKMSDKAKQFALELELSEAGKELVKKALAA